MIQCSHKHELAVVNKGVTVELCRLHGIMVNDTICRDCKDRDSVFETKPKFDMDFLERPPEELGGIRKCCGKCPLFQPESQTCKSIVEMIPVDVLAKNPSTHCPEGQW